FLGGLASLATGLACVAFFTGLASLAAFVFAAAPRGVFGATVAGFLVAGVVLVAAGFLAAGFLAVRVAICMSFRIGVVVRVAAVATHVRTVTSVGGIHPASHPHFSGPDERTNSQEPRGPSVCPWLGELAAKYLTARVCA